MIEKRKTEHLDICENQDVDHNICTGFEKLSFVHNALPEVDLEAIDTSAGFLGKSLEAPILISAMTGGTQEGARINKNLAIAAQKCGVALCLGSMRIAIAQPDKLHTFQVREYCPDIPLLANIGAVQLNYGFGIDESRKAVDSIKADGLVFHLNPLQEAMQPEGDTDFKGLEGKLKKVIQDIGCPVIFKEVGSGLSGDVAGRLKAIGAAYLDTAGAGGTSWSKIEGYRSGASSTFDDWGIPTVDSVRQCVSAGTKVIASGGVRTGVDIAKSIALGASFAGLAHPFLAAARESPDAVVDVINRLVRELKVAMFCVGAKDLDALGSVKLIES